MCVVVEAYVYMSVANRRRVGGVSMLTMKDLSQPCAK